MIIAASNYNYRYCPCEGCNSSINTYIIDPFVDPVLHRSSILDLNRQADILHGVDDSSSNVYGLNDNNNSSNNDNSNNNDNNSINDNANNKKDRFEFSICYIHSLYDHNVNNDNDNINRNSNKNNKNDNKKDNTIDTNIIDHNDNTQLDTIKVAGSPVVSRGVVSVVDEFESFDGYGDLLKVHISKNNGDGNDVDGANLILRSTNEDRDNNGSIYVNNMTNSIMVNNYLHLLLLKSHSGVADDNDNISNNKYDKIYKINKILIVIKKMNENENGNDNDVIVNSIINFSNHNINTNINTNININEINNETNEIMNIMQILSIKTNILKIL